MTNPILLTESRFRYLDPDLIIDSPDFKIVESFLKSTKRTEVGWHYIIDLAWIYSIIKDWPRSYKIIDAGGGVGPTQFMLAELGFHVTNIDLVMSSPSQYLVQRYGTQLTRLKSYEPSDYVQHLEGRVDIHTLTRNLRNLIKNTYLWERLSSYSYNWRHDAWRANQGAKPLGKIDWIQGNLCHMPEIKDASFDAVVSLSSLEHIPLDLLPNALNELERVLKPQSLMAITTSATDAEETWFHEPSKGACFSSKGLAKLFNAQDISKQSATEILKKYQKSSYLRDNLGASYYASGNNGMPWGKWNPRYIPVGIWR